MGRYRHLIVGAGRIGAGWNWHDDAYTHAGASRALSDRIELVGFVEPNPERADAAEKKWGVTAYESLMEGLVSSGADIVSVCVSPDDQSAVLDALPRSLKGVWCEKPFMHPKLVWPWPVQVNYLRRADFRHRNLARYARRLVVYGKDDIHTRCHFEDLAKWWKCPLDYRTFNGPCAYAVETSETFQFFDNGGVSGAECCRAMLENLLDHVERKKDLWSPAA